MPEKIDLPSVIDRDLISILQHYNLDEPLLNGEIECHSCSRVLTWENLGGIKVDKGLFVLFCDFPECLDKARSTE